MSLDPYDDYLGASQTRLSALRKIAAVRQKKFGKKGAWTKPRKKEAELLKARLERSNNPLLNKPRSEILKIAQGNTNRAFAPTEALFNQREASARALADKRQQDEKTFATWMNGQLAQNRAMALQSDQALQSAGHAIATAGGPGSDPAAVGANVAGQAGTITGAPGITAGSSAQSVGLSNQRSSELASAIGARNTSSGDLAKTYAYLDTVNAANSQTAFSRVGQDLAKTLDSIATDRTTASVDRADKLGSEVARLLDQELSKAQNNRDYGLAASQLAGNQANMEADNANDAAKLKLASLTQAQNNRIAKLKLGLENRKLTETHRNHIQTELARLIGANAAKLAAETGRKKFNRGDSAPGAKKKGKPSEGAMKNYRGLESGRRAVAGMYNGKNESAVRKKLEKGGYGRLQRDAILELLKHKKLSSGTIGALKGVYIPKNWRS